MKFLLYLFCILIFFPSSCSAIEEVILNIDDNNAPEPKAEKIFDEDDKFTLYEMILQKQSGNYVYKSLNVIK